MRLNRENSVLVVIDVQSKLIPIIYQKENLIKNLRKIIQGARVLEIPIIITEQYPKGLGSTISEIVSALDEYNPIAKTSFSCCEEKNFTTQLEQTNRGQILVTGIEAHICIYQTCIDLLDSGYEVYLLVDCTSSREKENRDIAINELDSLGIHLTSVEMALFEMLRVAEGKEFKQISEIIK